MTDVEKKNMTALKTKVKEGHKNTDAMKKKPERTPTFKTIDDLIDSLPDKTKEQITAVQDKLKEDLDHVVTLTEIPSGVVDDILEGQKKLTQLTLTEGLQKNNLAAAVEQDPVGTELKLWEGFKASRKDRSSPFMVNHSAAPVVYDNDGQVVERKATFTVGGVSVEPILTGILNGYNVLSAQVGEEYISARIPWSLQNTQRKRNDSVFSLFEVKRPPRGGFTRESKPKSTYYFVDQDSSVVLANEGDYLPWGCNSGR